MKRLRIVLCLFILATIGERVCGAETLDVSETEYATEENQQIKDSFPTFNRAIFFFNDKAYYYFFKPIHTGYKSVVPEKARISINDFFTNIRIPGRFLNCLFQGKFKSAGTEMGRFVINSTIGVGGFWDPSIKLFNFKKEERDFGQTLGKCKMMPGTYIIWPFIGPSNVRDTFGLIGDTAFNPSSWVSFLFLTPIESVGTYSGETVNNGSNKGDTYEKITKLAIDPYIALQDAYTKNREKKMVE